MVLLGTFSIYSLDNLIYIHNPIFFNFWRYTFYEFQGQSKGHKVNYLKLLVAKF